MALQRSFLVLAIGTALALSGCAKDASAPAADTNATPAPASATAKPQLGSFGFDADGMDRSVAAGEGQGQPRFGANSFFLLLRGLTTSQSE